MIVAQPEVPAQTQHLRGRARRWIAVAICVAVLLPAGAGALVYQRNAHRMSTIVRFWSPVFTTQQPVLICLAKPVTYRPSQALYQRYVRTHPGTFQSEWQRTSNPLLHSPDEKLNWRDIGQQPSTSRAFGWSAYLRTAIAPQRR
jgi:hypothetical protein